MALELFKPFVMKRLVELEQAANIKAAKRMVDRGASLVWDVLEEVITDQLYLIAQFCGQLFPAFPVFLIKCIFD